MRPARVRLFAAEVGYGGGLVLHTASSGAVERLAELYLVIERDGLQGLGEVRTNIAYLNGLAPAAVTLEAMAAIARVDWTRDPGDLLDGIAGATDTLQAPIRMLLDGALHDLVARRANTTVARMLGSPQAGAVTLPTNQTLFLGDDDLVMARAEAYVARGFRDLKVRVGAGAFGDDERRLAALRDRFGTDIRLAIDVNGRWSLVEAPDYLHRLARLDLAYVEQPVAPGDWDAVLRLAAESPMPLMLDESLASTIDVERIARAGGALWAHLKLVKLGGIRPTMAAARRLEEAGVPFMIGQMNEGAAATAAAAHVAAAARPRFCELYGADGLVGDPGSGVVYDTGTLAIPALLGLGIAFAPDKARLIQEINA